MRYLLEWLKGLLRGENIDAVIGSLKRRIFRLDFLEMRIALNDKTVSLSVLDDMEITGYSENLERECISLLNSVASLGFWNQSTFRKKILSSVTDPRSDIFVLCKGNSVVGFAVLHKKYSGDNIAEIGYVAISPGSRGEKLGYKLLMHILATLKRLDIPYAYVLTDSFRLPAIKTYLKAGFYPYIKSKNENNRWQKAMKKLKANPVDGNNADIKIIQKQ